MFANLLKFGIKKLLRSQKSVLLFIALSAFVLRVIFIIFPVIESGALNLTNDSVTYDRIAIDLVAGKGFGTTSVYPGYPLFLAVIYVIFGHSLFAVRFFHAILGSITCLIIYLIGRETFNRKTGIIAASFAIVYPYFLRYTGMILSETLAVFMMVLSTLFLVKYYRRPSVKLGVITGFFIGLTFFIKPVVIGFLGCVALGSSILIKHKRRALIGFLVIVGVFFITISPWVIRNSLLYQKLILLPRSGMGLYGSNNPYYKYRFSDPDKYKELMEQYVGERMSGNNIAEKDKSSFQALSEYIKNNPVDFVKGLWFKFTEFWRPIPHEGSHRYTFRNIVLGWLSAGFISLFGLLGMIYSYKNWRKTLISILIISYFTLTHTIMIGLSRYRLPIMPIMMVFSAHMSCVVCNKLFHKTHVTDC